MWNYVRNPFLTMQNVSWLSLLVQVYFSVFGEKRLIEVLLGDFFSMILIIITTGFIFLILNIVEIFYARKTNRLIREISDDFGCKLEITLQGVKDLVETNIKSENLIFERDSISDTDESISPDFDPAQSELAINFVLKTFKKIILEGEFDLADALMKLSLDGPIANVTKIKFYQSLTYVTLIYREKLLAECTGQFMGFCDISGDLTGTKFEGASSQRTSEEINKTHQKGPLRSANVLVRNLITTFYQEMLPEIRPIFDFKNLTIKSCDGFTYNFTSYHAVMTEFKTPSTQDKKVINFMIVLLKM